MDKRWHLICRSFHEGCQIFAVFVLDASPNGCDVLLEEGVRLHHQNVLFDLFLYDFVVKLFVPGYLAIDVQDLLNVGDLISAHNEVRLLLHDINLSH